MLIEAARGGHAGVVNLLLRQPRFTEALRNQILAHRQAMASSVVTTEHQNMLLHRKRARSHSSQVRGLRKQQKQSSVQSEDSFQGDPPVSYENQLSLVTGKHSLPTQQFPPSADAQSAKGQPIPDPKSVAHLQQVSGMRQAPSISAGTDSPGVKKKLSSPHTQQSSEGSSMISDDPSKFTLNPSYNFGQAILSGYGYPLFPALPQSSAPPKFSAVSSSEQPSASAGTVPSQGYLLPSIFAQSPAYNSSSEDERKKSQEALQNHTIDFTKQHQELVSALEGLMLQNDSKKSSAGVPEQPQGDGAFTNGRAGSSVQPALVEDEGGGRGEAAVELPQESDRPQIINSTAPEGSLVSLPSEVESRVPGGSSSGNQFLHPTIDKQYLAAIQNQMLANLDHAGLGPPASHVQSSTPSHPPPLSIESSTMTDLPSSIKQPLHQITSSNQFSSPSLSRAQLPQPIYSTSSQSLKHYNQHRGGHGSTPDLLQDVGQLDGSQLPQRTHSLSTSVLFNNANFPLDIPPPTDLIPNHVSSR